MSPVVLFAGLLLCYAALSVVVLVVVAPQEPTVPRGRIGVEETTTLTQVTDRTVRVVDRLLQRGWSPVSASTLELAGVKRSVTDFVILVGVVTLGATTLALLLGGPLLAVLAALLGPVGAKVYLGICTARRQAAFADQLDDSMQMLAGSLRAGHSLLRAVDAVAQEAESPTQEEFARIINETRIGRDLGAALEQTATRMRSQDFLWVGQAIGVHREVGGDLAEVLDQVGHTIRERNQIRRQVKALSAEGRLSAYVLMALPVGVGGFLMLTRPGYVAPLFDSLIGWALLALSAVLFVVGGFWLRKTVTVKF